MQAITCFDCLKDFEPSNLYLGLIPWDNDIGETEAIKFHCPHCTRQYWIIPENAR